MSQSDGWIKLHRKLIDSDIANQPEIGWVWIHLLMRANWADRQLMNGQILKRGQLIISQSKFSVEIGLTRQQVRTALLKLSTIRNLTSKSTNRGTLISIINYDKYQSLDEQSNQHINQPATSQQPEKKKEKNILRREEEKECFPQISFDSFWEAYPAGGRRDREDAEMHWNTLDTTLHGLILDKAKEYDKSDRGRQYPKSAANWLLGNCWKDDPAAWVITRNAEDESIAASQAYRKLEREKRLFFDHFRSNRRNEDEIEQLWANRQNPNGRK